MSRARDFADLAGSADAGGLTGRNVLVNGSMAVSQRGTSSTGQGASDLFLVDRFHLNTNGNSAGRFTVTQESDGPSGIPNSLKLACTTADTSIAASERFFIEQRLEGQDCQRFKKGTSDAEAITVSFYVKGNAAATYVVGIYDSDNSRQIGAQFSVTTSWNRVSVTFPADTGGSALDDDNAESLSLRFYLHAGSTYTGGTLQTAWDTAVNNEQVGSGTTSFFDSTSRTFFLTGVQLEVGEQATPFEHRSFGEEEMLCRRYHQRFHAATNFGQLCYAHVETTTQHNGFFFFDPPLRSAPDSVLISGNTGCITQWGAAVTGVTGVALESNAKGATQTRVKFTLASALGSAGDVTVFLASNDSDAFIAFDAEL